MNVKAAILTPCRRGSGHSRANVRASRSVSRHRFTQSHNHQRWNESKHTPASTLVMSRTRMPSRGLMESLWATPLDDDTENGLHWRRATLAGALKPATRRAHAAMVRILDSGSYAPFARGREPVVSLPSFINAHERACGRRVGAVAGRRQPQGRGIWPGWRLGESGPTLSFPTNSAERRRLQDARLVGSYMHNGQNMHATRLGDHGACSLSTRHGHQSLSNHSRNLPCPFSRVCEGAGSQPPPAL